MKRPSVLFINRVYPPVRGATGRVLRDLARSFAREGWDVTVVTTGSKSGLERDGGVKVIRVKGPERVKSPFVYSWIWSKLCVAALRQSKPSLVVTLTDPPLLVLAGQLVKLVKGSRHISWCQDLYPDILPVLNFKLPKFALDFLKNFSNKAMKNADQIIAIGRCMAGKLSSSGIDQKRISMIPNWPDFELILSPSLSVLEEGEAVKTVSAEEPALSKMDSDDTSFRPYVDLLKEDHKFRVLYAGNIGRAHPIDTILDAAEKINADYPEIEFIFVGDGEGFDVLAEERLRRGLSNVRLLPFQPAENLRTIMESGDVHLISIKDEAAGLLVPSKMYSAFAVERPCIYIGPESSEAARVITDFKAGTVVKQGDADMLAERIIHYRVDGDDWFAAHDGAARAGRAYVPLEAINAWIQKAWSVVESDVTAAQ